MGSKKKKVVVEQPNAAAPATPETPAVSVDPTQRVKDLLKAYPSLTEGYLCKKGVYFVKEIAEKFLEEGEELIIVTLDKE